MRYVVDTATGRALYAFAESDALEITEQGLLVAGVMHATDISAETHSVVEAEAVPGEWVGGAWTLAGGQWSIAHQALYAAVIAARAADRAEELACARDEAIKANNAAAGRARLVYLTDVPGQSATYQAKLLEAQRWDAAGQPIAVAVSDYPWATARAELLGTAVPAVLAEWLARAAAWTAAGILIETERERVNADIASAPTPEAVAVARSSAAYPAP